jgi:hypothetical protein
MFFEYDRWLFGEQVATVWWIRPIERLFFLKNISWPKLAWQDCRIGVIEKYIGRVPLSELTCRQRKVVHVEQVARSSHELLVLRELLEHEFWFMSVCDSGQDKRVDVCDTTWPGLAAIVFVHAHLDLSNEAVADPYVSGKLLSYARSQGRRRQRLVWSV